MEKKEKEEEKVATVQGVPKWAKLLANMNVLWTIVRQISPKIEYHKQKSSMIVAGVQEGLRGSMNYQLPLHNEVLEFVECYGMTGKDVYSKLLDQFNLTYRDRSYGTIYGHTPNENVVDAESLWKTAISLCQDVENKLDLLSSKQPELFTTHPQRYIFPISMEKNLQILLNIEKCLEHTIPVAKKYLLYSIGEIFLAAAYGNYSPCHNQDEENDEEKRVARIINKQCVDKWYEIMKNMKDKGKEVASAAEEEEVLLFYSIIISKPTRQNFDANHVDGANHVNCCNLPNVLLDIIISYTSWELRPREEFMKSFLEKIY